MNSELRKQLIDFSKSASFDYEFEPTPPAQRAYIHRLALRYGLKTKSHGKGDQRRVVVSKLNRGGYSDFPTTWSSNSEGAGYKRSIYAGLALRSENCAFELKDEQRARLKSFLEAEPLSEQERDVLLPGNEIASEWKEKANLANRLHFRKKPKIPRQRIRESPLKSQRESLPVYPFRETILDTIRKNQVVLISGETGCGKTTQVGQYIVEDCGEKRVPCRVIVTQPRRLPAETVAGRVAEEMGEEVGQTVGYHIRLDKKVSDRTLLTFCTSGILLRSLTDTHRFLKSCTHIILDEIHERDMLTDFVLTVLRNVIDDHPDLRIILMSATMERDRQLFKDFFGEAADLEVGNSVHEVAEFFLEDVLKITGYEIPKREPFGSLFVNDDTESTEWIRQSRDRYSTECRPHIREEECWDKDDCKFYTFNPGPVVVPWNNVYGAKKCEEELWDSDDAVVIEVEEEEALDQTEQNMQPSSSTNWIGRKESNRAQTTVEDEDSKSVASGESLSGVGDQSEEKGWEEDDKGNNGKEENILNDYMEFRGRYSEVLDVDLLYWLLLKLLDSSYEGSVLVFLPGYEDILAVKEKLEAEESWLAANYRNTPDIHILHSQMMNRTDPSLLFRPSPANHRKIILSTNIAEASITIDDVAIVVDSGFVKEVSVAYMTCLSFFVEVHYLPLENIFVRFQKYYDSFRNVSVLRQVWIAKSSAMQRMGRAGRCCPGLCYRLYSREKAASLILAPVPEMKREEIHQLCLHSKLVAPNGVSIADFLLGAPDPPDTADLKNAISFLKRIEALNENEELTELGRALCDLPLCPRLGLLLLNGICLRCYSPVLSIVAALSYRDPFQLSQDATVKEEANEARRSLAGDNYSDHYLLLRIVEEYEKAKRAGDHNARKMCRRFCLSRASMDMIIGIKEQLDREIVNNGFLVHDRQNVNQNSNYLVAIKAALSGGAYMGKIEKERKARISTSYDSNSRLFPGSMVHHQLRGGSGSRANLQNSPSNYLVFQERTQLESGVYLKTVSFVSACTVSLFTGPFRLPADLMAYSLAEENEQNSEYSGYKALNADSDVAAMKVLTERILEAIMDLLMSEEVKIGLNNPEELSRRNAYAKKRRNNISTSNSNRQGTNYFHRGMPRSPLSVATAAPAPVRQRRGTNYVHRGLSINYVTPVVILPLCQLVFVDPSK